MKFIATVEGVDIFRDESLDPGQVRFEELSGCRSIGNFIGIKVNRVLKRVSIGLEVDEAVLMYEMRLNAADRSFLRTNKIIS